MDSAGGFFFVRQMVRRGGQAGRRAGGRAGGRVGLETGVETGHGVCSLFPRASFDALLAVACSIEHDSAALVSMTRVFPRGMGSGRSRDALRSTPIVSVRPTIVRSGVSWLDPIGPSLPATAVGPVRCRCILWSPAVSCCLLRSPAVSCFGPCSGSAPDFVRVMFAQTNPIRKGLRGRFLEIVAGARIRRCAGAGGVAWRRGPSSGRLG